jgi:NAD(P)-dependent dehydrogenase (short-subunit alcohol dehydrogenase family)
MRTFLQDQVAIVAGASRGIGAATADALSAVGAAVVLTARSGREIGALAEELTAEGRDVLAVTSDVRDAAQVDALVAQATREFGRVDILVNVAAVSEPIGRQLWDIHPIEWANSISTNLNGPFHTMAAVLPGMVERGYGRVINVSSEAAIYPVPRAAPYCAGKAGLDQLCRVAARETANTGVTVNAVDPGLIDTSLAQQWVTGIFGDASRWLAGRHRRHPNEAATLILWLCSPDTSNLTGARVVWNDPRVIQQLDLFLANLTALDRVL